MQHFSTIFDETLMNLKNFRKLRQLDCFVSGHTRTMVSTQDYTVLIVYISPNVWA